MEVVETSGASFAFPENRGNHNVFNIVDAEYAAYGIC